MEFSLINVNVNIDRKLFLFMCTGLMLTIVLSDESNPVANVLRSIPPISLLDRYFIPVIKNAFGYFRGYGSLYGSIGAKVPFNADSFAGDGERRGPEVVRDARVDRRPLDGGADHAVGDPKSVGEKLKGEGLMMEEADALTIHGGQSESRYIDEESMPKTKFEMSKEAREDAHEMTKYSGGKKTFKKKQRIP